MKRYHAVLCRDSTAHILGAEIAIFWREWRPPARRKDVCYPRRWRQAGDALPLKCTQYTLREFRELYDWPYPMPRRGTAQEIILETNDG